MNIAQGNLVTVGLNKVYWKGQEVVGLVSFFIHSESQIVKLEVQGGAEPVLTDLEANGIKVRRLK